MIWDLIWELISDDRQVNRLGLRVVLSGHFCASPDVGHAKRIRLVFDYRITDLEAQIKTKKFWAKVTCMISKNPMLVSHGLIAVSISLWSYPIKQKKIHAWLIGEKNCGFDLVKIEFMKIKRKCWYRKYFTPYNSL